MIDSCDWNHPAVDAYTGTPRAAIMAMVEIPMPVRAVLVARAEAHDYDDTVYIDRDSIRSPKHAYQPVIRQMAFGARGRVCKTVTRDGWAADRVEGAWVYCESGWCVAIPAVCRNWFIATRLPDDQPEIPGNGGSPVVALADEPSPVTIAGPQTTKGEIEPRAWRDTDASDGAWAVGPAFSVFNGAGYAYVGVAFPGVPYPVLAVAEPETYALILAGLAAVAIARRRKA